MLSFTHKFILCKIICVKAVGVKFFMKKLGVIGGLGPLATAYFYELVTEFTKISVEQEHIEIILISKPQIPDRTAFILDKSKPSPLPEIINTGKTLVSAGADVIAIPCVTAHYFMREITEGIGVPVIDMIYETVRELQDAKYKKVGVMATTGTIRSGIFEKGLIAGGITPVIPDENTQKDVMYLIYDCIKAGYPLDMQVFKKVSDTLFGKGAECIILGCTELSMAKREDIGKGYIDVLEVLAKRSVELCGGVVKDKYIKLC